MPQQEQRNNIVEKATSLMDEQLGNIYQNLVLMYERANIIEGRLVNKGEMKEIYEQMVRPAWTRFTTEIEEEIAEEGASLKPVIADIKEYVEAKALHEAHQHIVKHEETGVAQARLVKELLAKFKKSLETSRNR